MIVTQHVDNRRSGANLGETVLRPDTIDPSGFGKLYEFAVNGAVYAQPLAAPGVRVAGGRTVNVLVVATMHNMIYAFDADAPPGTPPLWQRHLAPSIPLPDGDIGPPGYDDIEWEVGILSTPVIDTDRGAAWLVTTSRDAQSQQVIHQLWTLDLATGASRRDPVQIAAAVGNVAFVSHRQLQRSALLLSQNKIYVAFASYGDATPYAGWLLSYDADTLAHLATFCVTPRSPQGGEGGIWQSGQGPCADESGNLYVLTGNGDFDDEAGNYGDCAVSLDANLKVRSFFSPHDNAALNSADLDLGSGGLLAIPDTNMVVGGGKEGRLYLMDMNNLGGFDPAADHVLQAFAATTADGAHHIHGTPVFWAGPQEQRIFVWPENDQMKAFRFVNGRFDPNPAAQTAITDPDGAPGGTTGMPGGFLTLSANGRENGIAWANHPWRQNLNQMIGEGVLRGFDATTLEQKYSSRINPARDDFGNFAKFCPPTVANGRVYMATMGGLQRKTTLPEGALGSPVLANQNDQRLVLAWSGTDNPSHLNVIVSDDGITWGGKVTIPNETTPNAPALAFDGATGRTFIGWTGTDGGLNVMNSADPALSSWSGKTTLAESSGQGPALAFGNGRLFLAWTGTSNHLNVISSADGGATWSGKQTLNETSPAAPSLTFQGGVLYLLWIGTGGTNTLNVIESHDMGASFGNKVTLSETSGDRPALAFGVDGLPRLGWTGLGNGLLNELISETDTTSGFTATPAYKRVFYDTGANGPCLCRFKGRIYAGWTGTDPDRQVNVAELSRGAVAVYGRLPPGGGGSGPPH